MAFSPLALLNAVAALGGYERRSDVPYAEGLRRQLDVYSPAGDVVGHPVVVFFYGGSWQEGDRDLYRFVGAALARAGMVAVIPDYRVYPEVRFPDFLHDAARAVRWTRDHAAKHGGDPGRIVLLGHSAGAHIAAMLALDPQWLEAAGLDRCRDLAGMAGLAGPYDFLPLQDETLKVIFGPEAARPMTQPIRFARTDAVPLFLATGRLDRTVDPGNTSRLAARMRKLGGEVTEAHYAFADHRTILASFSPLLRFASPVFADTVRFVRRVTNGAD